MALGVEVLEGWGEPEVVPVGDTFTVNVVKFTPTVGLPSPPSPDDTEGEEDEVTDTEGEREGESVEEGEKVVRSEALGE